MMRRIGIKSRSSSAYHGRTCAIHTHSGVKVALRTKNRRVEKTPRSEKKSLVDAYGVNCIATGSLWRRCRRAPRTREAAYRAAFNGLRVEVKSRHRTPLRMHNRRWHSFSLHLKHLLVSHDRSKAFLPHWQVREAQQIYKKSRKLGQCREEEATAGEARLERYQRSTLGLCICAAKRSRAF